MAVPVVGPIAGAVLALISMIPTHPYGTCAPQSASMAEYLKCWAHSIPSNYIPRAVGGQKGWDWAYCPGAAGGSNGQAWAKANANFMGCGAGCDCTSGKCVCAPPGAVIANADGSYADASGNNLGPPVASTKGMAAPAAAGISQGISIGGSTIPWTLLVLGAGVLFAVMAMQ